MCPRIQVQENFSAPNARQMWQRDTAAPGMMVQQ